MSSWKDTLIFYEIYPTSFKDSNGAGIGELNGIASKLDYIKSLGFNAIWLNPFYKSPFKDGGYDISDFFSVDPRFGTIDDFKNLITKAHELGNRTIMMDQGDIIFDTSGEERAKLTVADFLEKFKESAGKALANDRMLLEK